MIGFFAADPRYFSTGAIHRNSSRWSHIFMRPAWKSFWTSLYNHTTAEGNERGTYSFVQRHR